jgi:S1-C subfamily serine protease
MGNRSNCVVILALLVCMVCPRLAWAGLPETISRVAPSVVGVGTAYPPRQPVKGVERIVYRGTGFVVGNGNRVITNKHVLATTLDSKNKQTHAVFVGNGKAAQARPARVVAQDEAHDLVLLAFDGAALPALALADSDDVRPGESIAFTGFPIGMVLGLYPVTHRGIIAAITPMAQPALDAGRLSREQVWRARAGYMAYQLDAVAYPGNSGSPVYDVDSAQVIGVLNSVLVKSTRESMLSSPSGISYAVPVKYVRALLARGE